MSMLTLLGAFVVFVCLTLQAENNITLCRFEFATLQGNTATANQHDLLDIPVRTSKACSFSDTKPAIRIEKIGYVGPEMRCLFSHSAEQCVSSSNSECKCPDSGSDRYHFLLSADPSINGTWRWSTNPAVVEKRIINILIVSTEISSTTKASLMSDIHETASIETSEKTTGEKMTGDESSHQVSTKSPDGPPSTSSIMLIFNGLVVLAIIAMVIVVFLTRRGRQAASSLPQDILLHQLQQQRARHHSPPRVLLQPLPEVQNHQSGRDLIIHTQADKNDSQDGFYEIIDDDDDDDDDDDGDDDNDEGAVGGTDVVEKESDVVKRKTVSDLPDDYLYPIASAHDTVATQSRNPVYQNMPQNSKRKK